MWWYTPIISLFGRQRQEDQELEANLSYLTGCYFKKKTKQKCLKKTKQKLEI
jgi:hypothetical protein